MAVTIEDIRALRGDLGNTNGSLAEAREMLYELIQYSTQSKEEWKRELEESRQERDRERKKSRQEWDRKMEESRQEWQQEIKESRQEFDRQTAIAVADRKRMNNFQEKLAHKLGTLVEDFVAPDMHRILHLVSGCPLEDISEVYVRQKRRLPHDKGQNIEIDAYVECDDLVLINETKEVMSTRYIDHFLNNQLARFREFFPEYRDYKLWGCVSSFRMEPSLVTYANRQGIITLALSDGLMQIQDAPDFKPKTF
ncbi:hypothetical protein QUF58_12875 [Anaerolineales bacterium HSG24]|nr:hypothetical protein [Anaerolineales bacterium HSG24]